MQRIRRLAASAANEGAGVAYRPLSQRQHLRHCSPCEGVGTQFGGDPLLLPRPKFLVSDYSTSWRQRIEQGLSLLKIARVEALGEPAIDRSDKIAGLLLLALITPKPRHAHRGA